MDQNFSGAVLLLILAAAGLVTGDVLVWGLAAATAALAFLADELSHAGLEDWAVKSAAASWAAVIGSAISLVI